MNKVSKSLPKNTRRIEHKDLYLPPAPGSYPDVDAQRIDAYTFSLYDTMRAWRRGKKSYFEATRTLPQVSFWTAFITARWRTRDPNTSMTRYG